MATAIEAVTKLGGLLPVFCQYTTRPPLQTMELTVTSGESAQYPNMLFDVIVHGSQGSYTTGPKLGYTGIM